MEPPPPVVAISAPWSCDDAITSTTTRARLPPALGAEQRRLAMRRHERLAAAPARLRPEQILARRARPPGLSWHFCLATPAELQLANQLADTRPRASDGGPYLLLRLTRPAHLD